METQLLSPKSGEGHLTTEVQVLPLCQNVLHFLRLFIKTIPCPLFPRDIVSRLQLAGVASMLLMDLFYLQATNQKEETGETRE